MALEFINGFDPRDPRVQAFIVAPSTEVGVTLLTLDPQVAMKGMGFAEWGLRDDPDAMIPSVEHACRLHCELFDGRSQAILGRFTVVVPASTDLSVDPSTRLGVRNGTDPAQAHAIQDAFLRYSAATHGPLPTYVAEVAATTGASPLDAGLFMENKCKVVARKIEEDPIRDWVNAYWNTNEQYAFYRILAIDWLADWPAPSESPNRIEGDLEGAISIVEKAFDEYLKKNDGCYGYVTSIPPIRVARTDLPDQIKIEWEWAYNSLPCGGGFHFWRPRTYRRKQEAVLYVTGAYPGTMEGVKAKILEIMKASALEAAFFALVSQDINQGIAVFKAAFRARCEDYFNNVERCLSAEIYVVWEPVGDWHL